MAIRIGISGWSYDGWFGTFYPGHVPKRRALEYAASCFSSIEVNGTFYSLQRPHSFGEWHDRTPEGFVFSIKGSRFITHMKALREVRPAVANFFAQGVLRLDGKLGPVLWQFPARMKYDEARFEEFFALLPRDTEAAVRLARRHDHRVRGRSWLRTARRRRIRHAVEVRHESFFCDEFLAMLRRHRLALVFSDAGPEWPYAEDVTSDFIYVRLHGAEEIYASGYGEDALQSWASRIRAWHDGREPADAQRAGGRAATKRMGRDVYVYFDNDRKVRAPADALRLAGMLNVNWAEEHPWQASGSTS
jgi:uncharacterized protein YecE (DUF72 family)